MQPNDPSDRADPDVPHDCDFSNRALDDPNYNSCATRAVLVREAIANARRLAALGREKEALDGRVALLRGIIEAKDAEIARLREELMDDAAIITSGTDSHAVHAGPVTLPVNIPMLVRRYAGEPRRVAIMTAFLEGYTACRRADQGDGNCQ